MGKRKGLEQGGVDGIRGGGITMIKLTMRSLKAILVESGILLETEVDEFNDHEIQKMISENFHILYESNNSQSRQYFIGKDDFNRLKAEKKLFRR